MQFANFMDDMVRDVEAGRPLPPLNLSSAGVRKHNPEANVATRRANAEQAPPGEPAERQRPADARSQPRGREFPQRRSHRMGRPDEPGGWGR